MVMAAFAGKGAACFCHPLDVVRVQMQTQGGLQSMGFVGTVKTIVSRDGPRGLPSEIK